VFEKVFGLPAHPLVVHAAVVLIPITVLTALGYVLVPRLRPRLGWVLVVSSLGGGVASVFAAETGDRLAKHLGGTPAIDKHGGFGLDTRNMALLMAVVAVVLVTVDHLRARGAAQPRPQYAERYPDSEWTVVGGPSRAQERRANGSSGSMVLTVVSVVLMLALLASAFGAAVSVARAGDTGARLVWQNV
jgi:uncharacterized membrane protein